MAGGYFDAVPIQSGAMWRHVQYGPAPPLRYGPPPMLSPLPVVEFGAKKKRSKQAGKAAAAKKQEKRKLKTSSVTKGKKR